MDYIRKAVTQDTQSWVILTILQGIPKKSAFYTRQIDIISVLEYIQFT